MPTKTSPKRALFDDCGVYFAYGSNMDPKRLEKRCPSASKITIGWLRDYQLVFNMPGTSGEGLGGGIANIVPNPGGEVHGVLYRINCQELQELNELEASMNYSVCEMPICAGERMTYEATLYIGPNDKLSHIPPTKEYGKFLLRGIKENMLPKTYYAKLEKLISEE